MSSDFSKGGRGFLATIEKGIWVLEGTVCPLGWNVDSFEGPVAALGEGVCGLEGTVCTPMGTRTLIRVGGL